MPSTNTRGARRTVARLIGLLATIGCAAGPDPADAEPVADLRAAHDPLEPLNRASLAVTYGVDTLSLRPAAGAFLPTAAFSGSSVCFSMP